MKVPPVRWARPLIAPVSPLGNLDGLILSTRSLRSALSPWPKQVSATPTGCMLKLYGLLLLRSPQTPRQQQPRLPSSRKISRTLRHGRRSYRGFCMASKKPISWFGPRATKRTVRLSSSKRGRRSGRARGARPAWLRRFFDCELIGTDYIHLLGATSRA